MLSFFLPFPSPTVSGPGTSPGESISHNYLESDRFSPSLFLPPPGVHAILLSSLDLCSRLLPGLVAEGRPILHLAAKTSLACMWKSSPIASLLKAPWLSTAHCIWDKIPVHTYNLFALLLPQSSSPCASTAPQDACLAVPGLEQLSLSFESPAPSFHLGLS